MTSSLWQFIYCFQEIFPHWKVISPIFALVTGAGNASIHLTPIVSRSPCSSVCVANLLFFRPTDTQRNCLLPLFDSPSQVTTYPHASTRNIVSDEELCVWHIDRPFKRITGLMLSFTFSPIRIEGFIFRNNSHSWDSKNYKAASVHRGKAQADNERNETTKGRKKPPEWGNISWN